MKEDKIANLGEERLPGVKSERRLKRTEGVDQINIWDENHQAKGPVSAKALGSALALCVRGPGRRPPWKEPGG